MTEENLGGDARLRCVAEVFEKIVDHAKGGGTFRKLIYDRLGFDVDAYATLCCSGGMTISNEFVIADPSPDDEALASRLQKHLWPNGNGRSCLIEGGKEPWLTVCAAAERIKELSAQLAREQEIRARIEKELAECQQKS